MADNEVSVYKSKMEEMIGNPAGMQRICLAQLEAMMKGEIDIVDPSNPFVFLMETATLLSTVAIEQNAINNRKQYPSVAVSEEDIYLHMSDEDYIDRFAKPAVGKFYLLLNLDEVNANVVTDPNDSNIRKLVIPKNTEITIADHKFTMQYPIEIRKLSYGGLQIVYDVSKKSPLLTLESNLVSWFSTMIDGSNFIALEIPMQQMEIKEYNAPLNISAGFVKSYLLVDKYYYTRAYISNTSGGWDEILTTHSDQIFDPTKVTALIKVFSDSIRFEIPTIYFSNGLVSNKNLRLDIFTTKGPIELVLSNYVSNEYGIKWIDLDNDNDGIFSAPLKVFKSMAVYSIDTISGGTDSINFETLRERVIENAVGKPDIPITNTQVVTTVNNAGFDVVKNLDNITDRQFLATREIPNAAEALRGITDISLLSNVSDSPIATAIKTITASIDEIKNLDTVYDNGNRVTISSNTLFKDVDGIITPVSNEELTALNAMPKENLIDQVNSSRYSYTPFHYVLDTSNDNFSLRAYHLDKPRAISKQFMAENDALSMEVSIGQYSIEKIQQGYRLYLVTASGENFKSFYETNPTDVGIQVSFKPYGSSELAYAEAVIKDPELIYGTGQSIVPEGELLYEVILDTTYDLDRNENIYLTNFEMNNNVRPMATPLTVSMDFIIYALGYGGDPSNIDQELNGWTAGTLNRGIVKERINIELGRFLDYIWTNSRTILSPEAYLRYDVDVPKIYTEDVYEIDPVTGLKKMTIVGGQVTFNKLHSVGEPYLDEDDQPIYEHRVGDVVLDINNNPVPVDQRKVTRQIDLCLFDGKYYFVTESTNKLYRDQVPSIFVSWLENDLANINSRLLERTVVYFFPKTTFGTSKIIVENGVVVNTYSEQSFAAKVYVPAAVYDDESIKSSIVNDVVDTIANALKKPVVSLTDVQYNIKTRLGDLIKGVEISGFGDNRNVTTFTVFDDTIRASIKKTLILLSENNISIKDDVDVEFIRHEL